ncbi:hypothetical Protein YC6258_01340 [Gynuella sunshinyii YC6258]|uniref:Uncharacterized protein n=1 Tax=Gynuella sunshinyii YC6258 TaxID=1445510 RepID=A0A0C5VSU2_9GAMM|nr:hypothetical Protein YC6258_01340 [Gynuella sunshinyii YC6258]
MRTPTFFGEFSSAIAKDLLSIMSKLFLEHAAIDMRRFFASNS